MNNPITWTDETWNPIVGCSKVSEGCQHCYAERMAMRLKAMGRPQYQDVVDENGWTGKTNLVYSTLNKPYHWKKPRMIFVGSMTDIFHESVPFWWLNSVFIAMEENPQHIFQILTKRPDRMGHFLTAEWTAKIPDNVWLGVSCENQKAADERIPFLLQIPAKVRFVSVEPMLEAVDLTDYFTGPNRLVATGNKSMPVDNIGSLKLDWTICGGESGPGARPLHPDWVRSLRDQCQIADISFHFKQWGEWGQHCYIVLPEKSGVPFHMFDDGLYVFRIGKKKAGRELDGKIWDEFPEVKNGKYQKRRCFIHRN